MVRKTSAPWKRPNPRKQAGEAGKHLSPAEKAAAKAQARRAGRRYPNLVDNMRMAKKKTMKKSAKKRAGRSRPTPRKTSARKSVRKGSAEPRERDPKGGLTPAGRKAFARKEGAHLRPGVTKKASEMTAQEIKRKGSWAVRFFGRKKLPPLVDLHGKATRHALSAHAWGEAVPRTVTAARRIAMKGKRLLERYQRIKGN
jgi:hypothetical protein